MKERVEVLGSYKNAVHRLGSHKNAVHKVSFFSELRSCVNREVGLGSHNLSQTSPIPNKLNGFCGRKKIKERSIILFSSNRFRPQNKKKCHEWILQ